MPRKVILSTLVLTMWIGLGFSSRIESQNILSFGRSLQDRQTAPAAPGQPADLSGTYVGTLRLEGSSGPATLVITGNSFKLIVAEKINTGRINAVTTAGYTAVTMSFDNLPIPSISLSARKLGPHNLRLVSVPGEKFDFYFVSGSTSHGLVANSQLVATNTNASANRSANTNTSANANTSASPVPTFRPERQSRIGPPVNANAKATSSEPVGGATPAPTGFYSNLKGDANVVFTTPDSMKLEETKVIELLVSPSESVEKLTAALSEPGKSGSGSTKYADRMEAQLTGTGFIITAIGPSIQPVEAGQTTKWMWQIKPKDAGAQRLDLTLNAVLNDGKDRGMVQTFHRDIRINVSWSQRASSFIANLKDLQWLWAVIIVPIAGAGYGWWHRKRKGRARRKK
jgi:hypothetical protein